MARNFRVSFLKNSYCNVLPFFGFYSHNPGRVQTIVKTKHRIVERSCQSAHVKRKEWQATYLVYLLQMEPVGKEIQLPAPCSIMFWIVKFLSKFLCRFWRTRVSYFPFLQFFVSLTATHGKYGLLPSSHCQPNTNNSPSLGPQIL